MSISRNDPSDHRDEPTYWFAVLEIARKQGDFDRAAEAQHELERLGVTVRFRSSRPRRREASRG